MRGAVRGGAGVYEGRAEEAGGGQETRAGENDAGDRNGGKCGPKCRVSCGGHSPSFFALASSPVHPRHIRQTSPVDPQRVRIRVHAAATSPASMAAVATRRCLPSRPVHSISCRVLHGGSRRADRRARSPHAPIPGRARSHSASSAPMFRPRVIRRPPPTHRVRYEHTDPPHSSALIISRGASALMQSRLSPAISGALSAAGKPCAYT